MESDEITTAPVIRPEDEFLRRQLRESPLDVARAKSRAIPPNRDNFVIAKLRDSLDRVFQASGKVAARLPMNLRTGSRRNWGRCEKVKINLR